MEAGSVEGINKGDREEKGKKTGKEKEEGKMEGK